MRQKRTNRVAALLMALAVCLTLQGPHALAAPEISEAETLLTQSAKEANLVRRGPAELFSAPQPGGVVDAVLDAPNELETDAPVLVLVQPVDEDGKPLSGYKVKYCLGTQTGESAVSLRYQQAGCSNFVMMAAQPAVDHGAVDTLTAAGTVARSICTVTYSASMIMSEDMATVVTVNKDDTDTLKSLRFTCYLEDELLKRIPDFSDADITFSGADTYEMADISKTAEGVSVTYKLRDSAVESWRTMDVMTVKAMLQTEMSISCQGEVSAADVTAAQSESGEIYTCGWVEITRPGGQVPYFQCDRVVIPAEPARFALTTESSGGTGGTSAPVEVVESTGGTVQAPSRANVGNTVTITVTPDAGMILQYLLVEDQNGDALELTRSGENTYQFSMPRGGAVVRSGFRHAVADPSDTGVSQSLVTEQHIAFMNGDGKGEFRPDDPITRAEVAQMFYRLLKDTPADGGVQFADVPADAWYAQAVEALAGIGAVNGVGGGCFAPEREITRAEFAALCARFAQQQAAGAEFTDVSEDHWAYSEIATAAAYGWIDGVGGGRFAPEREITRAEAAALVNRVLGRLGDIVEIQNGAGRDFPDVDMEHWAYREIMEAATEHDCTFNDARTLEYWSEMK